MHSPTFLGTFSSNYFMYICVDKLQNIYCNIKDSEHFSKCNFSFLYLRQSRVFFFIYFCLLKHYSVSITLLTVKCTFSHFSWYLFFKSLTYIYVGTYTKYLFQYKASANFDKFVVQNWFSLQIH